MSFELQNKFYINFHAASNTYPKRIPDVVLVLVFTKGSTTGQILYDKNSCNEEILVFFIKFHVIPIM